MNKQFEITTKSGDVYCVFAPNSSQAIDIVSTAIDTAEIATVKIDNEVR